MSPQQENKELWKLLNEAIEIMDNCRPGVGMFLKGDIAKLKMKASELLSTSKDAETPQ